jgi:precorrin-6B methylase 2
MRLSGAAGGKVETGFPQDSRDHKGIQTFRRFTFFARWSGRIFALGAAIAALVACNPDRSKTEGRAQNPPPEGAYANDPEALDIWLQRLEVSSREIYSARAAVAAAVELRPGARIADVGAGTGVYTFLFAERVGSEGAVFAVDIEPRFLKLINQRAEEFGLANVVSVLSRADSITLPPGTVDAVFICDTYHYFEDPGAIMETVRSALKPGGSLYIVDYDLEEGAGAPPDRRYVRFGKEGLSAEVESFGFSPPEEISVPGLSENYMLRFRKPD